MQVRWSRECNVHYNISEGMEDEKATTVPEVEQRLKDIELDYEKGSQIEGGVHSILG